MSWRMNDILMMCVMIKKYYQKKVHVPIMRLETTIYTYYNIVIL